MRKRISVCMLVAMMNVTSLYSFATHGAETKTEQETGIEQESEESETQTEEAVDPMSADRLLMRARDLKFWMHILVKESGMKRWLQIRIHWQAKEMNMMVRIEQFLLYRVV